MKSSLSEALLLAGSAALLAGLVSTAAAQESSVTTTPPMTPSGGFIPPTGLVPHPDNSLKLATEVNYSYVAAGKARFRAVREADSDAHSLHANIRGALPLNENWFVPLGVSTADSWLESVPNQPIPERINTVQLTSGLGYRFNDQWTFSGTLTPRLYRLEDVSSRDVGMGGALNVLYQASPTLTLAGGLAINPDSEVSVMPLLGVRWEIQTNLVLNLMAPRPLVIYKLNSSLSVFAGGDFNMTTFRANSDQGSRLTSDGSKLDYTRFNNAIGTYRDVHLGAGIQYELLPRLSLTLEGGCSVWRRISYSRLDQSVNFNPAPYVQTGIKYAF